MRGRNSSDIPSGNCNLQLWKHICNRIHKKEIHVEICSKCHPFYTGQQKAASARGRIDKFNRKYGLNKNKHKAEREG